jgi:tetratricopeptide (TPR) repeat protein
MIDEALKLLPDKGKQLQKWEDILQRTQKEITQAFDTCQLRIDCLYASNLRKNIDEILELQKLQNDIAGKLDYKYQEQTLYNYAWYLNYAEKYDEALNTAQEALRICQNNNDHYFASDCYVFIGDTFIKRGNLHLYDFSKHDFKRDYKLALENFKNALQIDKDFFEDYPLRLAECYISVAKAYINMDDYENVLKYLDCMHKIIETIDKNDDVQLLQAEYYYYKGLAYAIIYYSKKDDNARQNSIDNLEKALKTYPEYGNEGERAYCFFVIASEFANKDFELAKKYIDTAINFVLKTCQNSPIAFFRLALILSRLPGLDWAVIKLYEQALNKPSEVKITAIYHNIGVAYSKIGDYSKACQYYLRELENTDISSKLLQASCYCDIGYTWYMRRKYATARNYFVKAYSIYTQEDTSWKTLYDCARSLGSSYRKALITYSSHNILCAWIYASINTLNMIQKKQKNEGHAK